MKLEVFTKNFAEMQDSYKEIVKRFNKIELQEWNAEGAMIELAKQLQMDSMCRINRED